MLSYILYYRHPPLALLGPEPTPTATPRCRPSVSQQHYSTTIHSMLDPEHNASGQAVEVERRRPYLVFPCAFVMYFLKYFEVGS